jgi:DNA-binding protein HU-beta
LIEKIAADSGISKATATKAVNSFLGTIATELKKKDGKVSLTGFGSFSKVHRKARTGKNPQTGETIHIKASDSVKFKPGKKLKDAV